MPGHPGYLSMWAAEAIHFARLLLPQGEEPFLTRAACRLCPHLMSVRTHTNTRLACTCSDVCCDVGDQRMAFRGSFVLLGPCLSKARGGTCVACCSGLAKLQPINPSHGLLLQATPHCSKGVRSSDSTFASPRSCSTASDDQSNHAQTMITFVFDCIR